jgi:hypothetical protein
MRPRLVTAGALAAVVGVIGISFAVAGSLQGSTGPTTVSAVSGDPLRNHLGPTPSLAVASPTAVAPPSAPAPQVTSRVGVLDESQTGEGYVVHGVSAEAVPWGTQIVLPEPTDVDWVVFGSDHGGVTARYAQVFPLFPPIDPSRVAGVGTARRDAATSVSWTKGMAPHGSGTDDTDRLHIPGGASATLGILRGSSVGRLRLYVGAGTLRISVTTSQRGLAPSTITVSLGAAATGAVTLDLSGLPFWGTATVTLTGAGGSSFSLVAATLS